MTGMDKRERAPKIATLLVLGYLQSKHALRIPYLAYS